VRITFSSELAEVSGQELATLKEGKRKILQYPLDFERKITHVWFGYCVCAVYFLCGVDHERGFAVKK